MTKGTSRSEKAKNRKRIGFAEKLEVRVQVTPVPAWDGGLVSMTFRVDGMAMCEFAKSRATSFFSADQKKEIFDALNQRLKGYRYDA